MTEKRFEVWEQEPTKETTQSKVTVTVDDIIGLIKNDEHTNSVEEVRKLRGRETENLSKNILDLEEELAYYKSKCASLEEGMFNLERENEQLKKKLDSKERLIKSYEQYLNDLKEDGVLDD